MLTAMTGKIGMAVCATIVAFGLAGCGGGSDDAPDTTAPPAEASSETTSEAPAMTMIDVCPEVEAALPEADGLLPDPQDVLAFERTLNELRAKSDTETQNALDLFTAGTTELLDASSGGDAGAILDARGAWRDAIGGFADRCKAAGSSALQ